MKVHPDELALARAYSAGLEFEDFSAEQMRMIMERGRSLHKWFKAHLGLHSLINALLIVAIFAADWFILMRLPGVILPAGTAGNPWLVVSAAVLVGALHGWLMYSMSTFSLHEGAAHHLIFPGSGRLSRIAQFSGANLCRLAAADPDYYAVCHMAHHAKFGTEDDSEFLNFIRPRRLWPMFLPFGAFLNFSDFVIHRPLHYTRSRLLSALLGSAYTAIYLWLVYQRQGPLFAATVLLVLPHAGFYADRLRQFTEHNLMPLDNRLGTRSLGVGFWGMLIGGGPWGQPCHMAHHLVASLPWYQQLILHRYMVSLLTERQRSQFLLRPGWGFPLLLWRIIRDANAFAREPSTGRRLHVG